MGLKRVSYIVLSILTFFLSNCADTSPLSTLTPAKEMAGRAPPQQPASPLPSEPPAAATKPLSSTLTYRGEAAYPGARPYEINYEATQWQLIEDFDANPLTPHDSRLQNQLNSLCFIALYGGPIEVNITGSTELTGRKWLLATQLAWVERTAKTEVPIIIYLTDATDPVMGPIGYFFTVILPSSEQEAIKSPCQQAAEQVIATFRIVDALSPK